MPGRSMAGQVTVNHPTKVRPLPRQQWQGGRAVTGGGLQSHTRGFDSLPCLDGPMRRTGILHSRHQCEPETPPRSTGTRTLMRSWSSGYDATLPRWNPGFDPRRPHPCGSDRMARSHASNVMKRVRFPPTVLFGRCAVPGYFLPTKTHLGRTGTRPSTFLLTDAMRPRYFRVRLPAGPLHTGTG